MAKKTQTKSPKTLDSRKDRLEILSLMISILSFFLSAASMYLVETQNDYTNLFLPFTYSATRAEPATLHYCIGDNGLTLPAYDTQFQIETGACEAFYIIAYNGNDSETITIGTQLKTKDSPSYRMVTAGPMPYESFPEDCQVLFDYFFVYSVSASKETELALFYYRIDLEAEMVTGPIRMNQIELLNTRARQNNPLYQDRQKP